MGVCLPIVLCLLALHLSKEDVQDSAQSDHQSTQPSDSLKPMKNRYMISLIREDEKLDIDLENYVLGVVLAEMPASFELEALKAQAVAARTYALKSCSETSVHGKNTICARSTCCQAYVDPESYITEGGNMAAVERVRYAVEATVNQVLMYEDALISATYFSCSGGRTEAAVEVWGYDYPYLQSVNSLGEEDAAYYTDFKIFTAEEFQLALGITLKGNMDSWFGEVCYTDGGGVQTMTIGGVAYRGTTLRTLLGLRSTVFSVQVDDNRIIFHTKGYGHRVGMSQYGANAMAKQMYDYTDILLHYYTGVEIVQLFENIEEKMWSFS